MNDIEVGEYVRISERCYPCGIAKVVEIDEANIGVNNTNDIYTVYYSRDKIKKHSKNIIDVLEVEDIVNSRKVEKIFIDPFTKKKRLQVEGTEINWQGDMSTIYIECEDIKSILTHEQYESNVFRLEE